MSRPNWDESPKAPRVRADPQTPPPSKVSPKSSTRAQRTKRLVELGAAISKVPPNVKHCRALLQGTGWDVYQIPPREWDLPHPRIDQCWVHHDPECPHCPRFWIRSETWERYGHGRRVGPPRRAALPETPAASATEYTEARMRAAVLGDIATVNNWSSEWMGPGAEPRPDTGKPDAWAEGRLETWLFYIGLVAAWGFVLFLIWWGPQ